MTHVDLDVVVVGSLHLDIVVKAQALPIIDETARGTSWHMVCGGKGGNQAVWAARLGAKTAMISRVGNDDFGNRLLANLDHADVDRRNVSIDTAIGSGMSVAILQDNGEYGAVIVSGSNLSLKSEEVLSAFDALGKPRIVVLQNEIDETINLLAARHAKSIGACVVFNAAPARPMIADLASCIDVLVVNRVEAEMMSGMPTNSVAAGFAALTAMRDLAKNVIVTLGSLGLIVAEYLQEPVFIAAHKITPVSTHGAGDCFVGQLTLALAKGRTVMEASVLANKTAALFVSGKSE